MRRRIVYLLKCLGLLALPLAIVSCYPDGASTTDELTTVVTRYDLSYDFGSKKTFYLLDSVAFATNIDNPDYDEEELRQYEQDLLNAVEINMSAAGYESLTFEEAEATPPDMVLMIAAVATRNSGYVWNPGWWWGSYPPGWGWGPGWGWYYPPGWGGGYYYSYSYDAGTVLIYLADYENVEQEGDVTLVPIEWEAEINGLLSTTVDNKKIVANIEQAFIQSPYLNAK